MEKKKDLRKVIKEDARKSKNQGKETQSKNFNKNKLIRSESDYAPKIDKKKVFENNGNSGGRDLKNKSKKVENTKGFRKVKRGKNRKDSSIESF